MSLEEIESISKREQLRGKQYLQRVHSTQQLAPRASIEAVPRVVLALRRAKTVCESSGKAVFHPYICLARRMNCTHSAMARGDGFLVRLGLISGV